MKRCGKCFKKIPARDTYCENCNIKFYNLNKQRSFKSKENNKMIDETQVEEKEGEVSEEADKATETSE